MRTLIRYTGVGRLFYVHVDWLRGCWATKQQSTANTLAGVLPQFTAIHLYWRGNWTSDHSFSLVLSINSTWGASSTYWLSWRNLRNFSHFLVEFGHTSIVVLKLCCQSSTRTCFSHMLLGLFRRSCVPSQFNNCTFFFGVEYSCLGKYLL